MERSAWLCSRGVQGTPESSRTGQMLEDCGQAVAYALAPTTCGLQVRSCGSRRKKVVMRVTSQRVLLRLLTAGILPGPCRTWIKNRVWTIEEGEAAGLKLAFSQNL